MTIRDRLFAEYARGIISVLGFVIASVLAVRYAGAQRPGALTAQDSVAVEEATLADARVRAIVGAGRPRIIVANAAFCSLLGCAKEDVTGIDERDLALRLRELHIRFDSPGGEYRLCNPRHK